MRPWALAARPPQTNGLWTVDQYKMVKSRKAGFHSVVLHLAPADTSGLIDVCPYSTPECRELCLNTAGFGVRPVVQDARFERTRRLVENRSRFLDDLVDDLQREMESAAAASMELVARPNGTSDLPWLGRELARRFQWVQFYDYTKVPRPWLRQLPNYHLTFSRAEDNWPACEAALEHEVNVAVVFDVRKDHPLPASFAGRPVVDGDLNDLRFLDPPGGVIIGLRAKGLARGRAGGFVVSADAVDEPAREVA